jgi:hypothetical protein
LLRNVRLEIRLRRARVDENLEALDEQLHSAEQADRARAEHDCIASEAAPFSIEIVVLPAGHALLHDPRLREALLRDRERLGHHGEVAQILRHWREVRFLLDPLLGHVAVELVDAALLVRPSETKILPPLAARLAVWIRARPAHAGHDEIARFEFRDARPDLGDFAKALVAEHEVVAARRPVPVCESANLAVRPADADLDRADADLIRRGDFRLGVRDDAQLLFRRNDADAFHGDRAHGGGGWEKNSGWKKSRAARSHAGECGCGTYRSRPA